jgi:plastocyanin
VTSLSARLGIAACALAVVLAGCAAPDEGTTGTGGGGDGTGGNDTSGGGVGAGGNVSVGQSVAVRDNVFEPSNITASAGSSVRFANFGQAEHTITLQKQGDTSSFFDQEVAPGASVTVTFDHAGSYELRCRYHSTGFDSGMVGRVTVS